MIHQKKPSIKITEELAELSEEFNQWISDYDYEHDTHMRRDKLGGYVDFHSNVNEIAEYAEGKLLLEFSHPFNSDDSFYFFIEDARLSNRDFSEVEFYFVCD